MSVVARKVGLREAEVENLWSMLSEKDVGWLDVAMDDSGRVSGVQAVGECDRHVEKGGKVDRTASASGAAASRRAAAP